MPFRPSRPVAVLVTMALLGTAAGAAAVVRHVTSNDDSAAAEEHYAGNARRFLDLTSEATGITAGKAGKVAAAAAEDDKAAAITGDFTPSGWRVRPAGKQVKVFNFPLGMTTTPDASQIIVSSDSGGMQGLSVIDANALSVTRTPATNLFLGVAALPGGRVFASGGNANRLFRFRMAGPAVVSEDGSETAMFPNHNPRDGIVSRLPGGADPVAPASDGIPVDGYPGTSVLRGQQLFVAGTLSEPSGKGADACPSGQEACARVSVVDVASEKVVGRAPVGLDAYGLAIDPGRNRLYVSNWADEAGRGAGAGTVSVVDISDANKPHEIGWVKVGHHPSAVQLSADRSRLFVANTNDDSISVLDVTPTGAPKVVATESVRPLDGVPVGAHPDAFALSPDGATLFVALAGMNAVEVRDGRTGARVAGRPMYIPTGWYPSALLVTGKADKYKLWVANAKGAGAQRKSSGLNASVGQEGPPTDGTVSVIDLPAPAAQANKWTDVVHENDALANQKVDPCNPGGGIKVSEVLCPPKGKASPIRHVLYIVTENKTFDQYFGDLDPTKYDADATYSLYNRGFTPNHHALADTYNLSDRFFSDAQVSVTGHSWTSGAVATDHNEKTFPADYDQGLRGNHGNGDPLKPGTSGNPGKKIQDAEDELDDPEGGYIFEAFRRAGAKPPSAEPSKDGLTPLSMAIYGESTARESGDMSAYKAPHWSDGDIQYFDTCRAAQFISGSAPKGPVSNGSGQFGDCQGRKLPPQFNLKHWTDVFKATGKDVMPNFIYMTLPVNHTLGTNLGSPTPASMVADNDYAIGLITQALSKSPFWGSTVVMQTEDDTQAAGDHISPLRDYLEVTGPWARPGVNHQWGSMPSLLRTIEQLFGVAPISLHDRLALPQHGAFRLKLSDKPNMAPYTAIHPAIPFALNQPGAPGQAASMAMDWSTVDRIDMQTLNAILYADGKGWPLNLPAYADK